MCCDSWGLKEPDTTEWLNWTELNWYLWFKLGWIHWCRIHRYERPTMSLSIRGFRYLWQVLEPIPSKRQGMTTVLLDLGSLFKFYWLSHYSLTLINCMSIKQLFSVYLNFLINTWPHFGTAYIFGPLLWTLQFSSFPFLLFIVLYRHFIYKYLPILLYFSL